MPYARSVLINHTDELDYATSAPFAQRLRSHIRVMQLCTSTALLLYTKHAYSSVRQHLQQR